MTAPPDRTDIDIFISYAREDRACAERFAEAFESYGWRVWWDRDIAVGADFAAIIESSLQSARAVVVLWSEHSVGSGFVKDEAGRARDASTLHPVRIADVPLPLGFGHMQTCDLLECGTEGADFSSLAEQLGRIIATAPGAAAAVRPRRRGGLGRTLRRPSTWIGAGGILAAVLVAFLVQGWRVERRCNEAFGRTDTGVQKLQEGSTEQAIDFFTEAIRMCGSQALPYRYRGEAYARLNDYPLAAADLERALALGLEGHGRRRATQLLATIAVAQKEGAIAVAGSVDEPPPPGTDVAASPEPAPPMTDAGSVPTGSIPTGGSPIGAAPSSRPTGGSPAPAGPPSGASSTAGGAASANTRVTAKAPSLPPTLSLPSPAPAAQPLEADPALRQAVQNMFAADRDARIEATTSLVLDSKRAARAVPLAVDAALNQITNASGVINTLVVLQAAGPAALRRHGEAVERLLTRATPNGPQTADLVAKVRAAMSPLAYIYLSGDAQRAIGGRLKRELESRGFQVPAIGKPEATTAVPGTAPEIRVRGASGRGAAQVIGTIVQQLTKTTPTIVSIAGGAPSQDSYEIRLDQRTCIAPTRRPPACGG